MEKVGQGDGNTYTVSVEALQREIARLTAALAQETRAKECFQRMTRAHWDALCAMRNSINEYIPMPNTDSGPLFSPEDGPIYADIAERVVASLKENREYALALEQELKDRTALAEAEARSAALVAGAFEAAARTVDTSGDSAVTEALGQRLCCSGHHCGCQGADVGAFLMHLIRDLTPADATAALARLIADARKEGMREAQTKAATDVLAERQRQISAEGWTPGHDDAHMFGEMATAASSYAAAAGVEAPLRDLIERGKSFPENWPWSKDWWKPTTRRRDLVKAGALILAEIERLDRAALQPKQEDV